jgi:hypothetical protein
MIIKNSTNYCGVFLCKKIRNHSLIKRFSISFIKINIFMLKKSFCFVLLMMNMFVLKAQNGHAYTQGFRLSAGATLAIPSSNLSLWGIGLGADLMMQYGVAERLALTGDIGLTNLFSVKEIEDYRIVPIRIGARYFATDKIYLAAKTGVGFLKVKGVEGATALAYTVGAGYMAGRHIDLGLAYDGYSKNGTIGLVAIRLGYFFSND